MINGKRISKTEIDKYRELLKAANENSNTLKIKEIVLDITDRYDIDTNIIEVLLPFKTQIKEVKAQNMVSVLSEYEEFDLSIFSLIDEFNFVKKISDSKIIVSTEEDVLLTERLIREIFRLRGKLGLFTISLKTPDSDEQVLFDRQVGMVMDTLRELENQSFDITLMFPLSPIR